MEIPDQTEFFLDEKLFQEFVDILDDSPRENPRLRNLLNNYMENTTMIRKLYVAAAISVLPACGANAYDLHGVLLTKIRSDLPAPVVVMYQTDDGSNNRIIGDYQSGCIEWKAIILPDGRKISIEAISLIHDWKHSRMDDSFVDAGPTHFELLQDHHCGTGEANAGRQL